MRIQHNILALNTHRNLLLNNTNGNKGLEKLSSGYRINRAGDDAAGLVISEKMRCQIRGLNMSGKNIQDGISLIQTAEGGMNEIHSMLQRVRELSVQSANDTNTSEDRAKLQLEVTSLFDEINSISERTEFNGMKVLRGGGSIDPRGPSGGGTSGPMLTGQALINAQTSFTERLVQSTLEASENMLASDYGLTVSGKTMTLSYITDSSSGMVARVWPSSNPTMEIDNADFFTEGSLWIDEDRIVAHEMVHAVMAASGINMDSMPDWFIEGSAEFLPGAKERLEGSVNILGVQNTINMITSSTKGSHFYSAGYAATIYLDQKLRQSGNSEGLKNLLEYMQSNPSKTFEQAMKDKMNNQSYSLSTFVNDFKANGASVVQNVLTNAGVGAISEITGLDGDGNLVFGSPKTNETIVPDTTNKIDSNGFNYVFKNNTHYTDDMLASILFSNYLPTIDEGGDMKLQLGANEGQNMNITMPTITTDALGLNEVDIEVLPEHSITLLDNAIGALSHERSKLGAIQNRLEHAYENVVNTSENLTAAESRIRDTDMAKEMMNFTKQNILMQAAQSMLSQANQQPQGVLQLLG
ncbi:flagellin [Ureibacillus xyleni]|uniref:Flagellin n=1 Tax=Ureibacillus xyleni TaxID=614648 RepID=A0A285RAF0_9BACL|nr:flagellin [Ureibacillus xyleni]